MPRVVVLGGAPCEAVQAVIERPDVGRATPETWTSFVAQLVKAL